MKHIFILTILTFSLSALGQTVLFLGDSLTEGYGINPDFAYPALIEKKIKDEGNKNIVVINGGVSGSTTSSGLKRLQWYSKRKPTHMVLALGANDGLRGLKVDQSEKNLRSIIEAAQKQGMKVILAGMKMPTNYGTDYRENFEAMYPKLSKEYKIPLIPFLLDNVGGVAKLNLPDGIHPNPEGHKILAETVWKVLKDEL
jgi:acyl-CoA thioesterase-1